MPNNSVKSLPKGTLVIILASLIATTAIAFVGQRGGSAKVHLDLRGITIEIETQPHSTPLIDSVPLAPPPAPPQFA